MPSLCALHLAAVLAASPDVGRGGGSSADWPAQLERVAEDLRTYALKRESSRRQLMSDEERVAYLYAIAHVAGYRQLARRGETTTAFPEIGVAAPRRGSLR